MKTNVKRNTIRNWVRSNVMKDGHMTQSKTRVVWWKNRPDQLDKLIQYTRFLPSSAPLGQRIYHAANGIKKPAVCQVCRKEVKYRHGKGYTKVCSMECSRKIIGKLSRKGSMQKLGVKNPSELDSVRRKISRSVKKFYKEQHSATN